MERPIYLKKDVDMLHKMVTDYCDFCQIDEDEVLMSLFINFVNQNEFNSKSEGRRIRIQSQARIATEQELENFDSEPE